MPCLGLGPAAYATGERRQQGAMTQAGHPQARRVLGEGAWASQSPAPGSRHVPRRLEKQPTGIPHSRWKAPLRLWKRSRRRASRGKHANVVPVASTRERAGCMWAIAQQGPLLA